MKQHKLFWGSSYDRGLDILLFLWEDIRKAVPDAELHVCYGWNLFDKAAVNNPERQQWKKNVQMLMGQDGIIHHGRVSKGKLSKIRKQCGIWAYPTYFTEINCITALDAQKDGCVPVVCNFKHDIGGKEYYTALEETVYSGIKVEGNIKVPDTLENYKKSLIKMMTDKKLWTEERKKGIEGSQQYEWANIAKKWARAFKKKLSEPLVSIYTPTIRQGFWNIMANNIYNQTYKNIEWIVVDDFKEDRSKIASEYAEKYQIDIKYLRGKENNPRKYGLSSANNIGWKNADGELLVFLQDFILMPRDGIEQFVDIYRHNPRTMVAATDIYYYPNVDPNTDKEDWFDGKTDIIGKLSWTNKRNQYLGMRPTTNPGDWEANYGSVPMSVVKDLNGWWEFFDEALGFDNTEFTYRALKAGYEVIIDDTNVATGLDHWKPLKDKPEQLGEDRERNLNDPRFFWMKRMMKENKLPLARDEEIDNKLLLKYKIPEDVLKDEVVKWMNDHMEDIMEKWVV